jgi:hypothetical protein
MLTFSGWAFITLRSQRKFYSKSPVYFAGKGKRWHHTQALRLERQAAGGKT